MLDLSVLAQETLDIKLLDGEIVCIKKPSKGLLIELNKADLEMAKETDFEKMVEMLERIIAKILSNNLNKKLFTTEQLEELDIDYLLQTQIFEAYLDFVTKFLKNPN
ncbi:hypothetical protein [Zhenhengia sp.]|uniref:hypothetical protein n=1 Tax=Zhenhengia sp. TaxID=2944208 RepID=UPI0030796724